MEAVAFQSNIVNDTIKIPERYQGNFSSPVLVTISVLRDVKAYPYIVPRGKLGQLDSADLGAPFIHTKGWKFNRDEANAR